MRACVPSDTWRIERVMASRSTPTLQDAAPTGSRFDRFLTHLDANEIDLKETPIRMGPMLTMDAQQERFTGAFSESANMLVSRNYREPYVVPHEV